MTARRGQRNLESSANAFQKYEHVLSLESGI